MARLKVYKAEFDGLHEWVVAAPNQAKALEAFGIHQNLFAQGKAGETKDEEAVDAALTAPGDPLRRLKGSKAAFARPDANDDGWEAALKAVGGKALKKARAVDRSKLDTAEEALEVFDVEAKEHLSRFDEEQRSLDARRSATEAELDERREVLAIKLEMARAAYRNAGGSR